jgi:hypothetical protein
VGPCGILRGCGAVNIHFPARSVAQRKNRKGENEEERGRAEDTIVKRIVKLREHALSFLVIRQTLPLDYHRETFGIRETSGRVRFELFARG